MQDKGIIKAYADIILDGCFKVNGLAVIDARRGIFIGMPFREVKNGNSTEENKRQLRKEICHPITEGMRKEIEDAILQEYEKGLN